MQSKRKILVSALIIVLVGSMLMGTTLAWLSDGILSAETPAGSATLDAQLYWSDDLSEWHDAEDGTAIFGGGTWEPGYTQVRYIKVVNGGSLPLRYALQLSPQDSLGKLAQVIDVYWDEAPADAYTSRRDLLTAARRAGTLAELSDTPLEENVLLAEGQSHSDYQTGSRIFVLALHMQEQAGNEYQGLGLGTFSLNLDASQFPLEDDAGNKTVVLLKPLVAGVTEALPNETIAASSGVNFTTSPYAYTNTTLFSGKHITKIGIPVKTVQALDNNQTFTLSVVKNTSDALRASSGGYQYTEQYELKMPLEQLGSSTTVNKWVYVDVNIQVAEDETLAFGMPTDTVEWGYLKQNIPAYNFRSANGNSNALAILFDVYAEQTLTFKQTENGLVAAWEEPVFSSVLADFPETAIAGGNNVEFTHPPYAYTDTALFSGSRITRIGIPVKTVRALDENQTFTLSVVKTTSTAYEYVKQYPLTLPLDQLGDSTTVNKWVYVDVSDLNIQLGEDETLAFGGKTDTVVWGWKRNYASNTYKFRSATGTWSSSERSIFFDVHTEKTLTYEDYEAQLRQEQEQLEAEQEKLNTEQALKQILSGSHISILGDSISTFRGYSNNTAYNSTIGSNAVYYTGSNYITDVNETWWMQAINRTGMELLVNNSWSGDCVTNRGKARALELDNNADVPPDIIAVYLGINDFRTKVTADAFGSAYEAMITGMREKYPDAQVFLFTLVYTTDVNSGVNPDDVATFNDQIRAVAQKYSLPLVDLYSNSGITKETMAFNMGDGKLHPNYAGMDKITDCFINVLAETYVTE